MFNTFNGKNKSTKLQKSKHNQSILIVYFIPIFNSQRKKEQFVLTFNTTYLHQI